MKKLKTMNGREQRIENEDRQSEMRNEIERRQKIEREGTASQ